MIHRPTFVLSVVVAMTTLPASASTEHALDQERAVVTSLRGALDEVMGFPSLATAKVGLLVRRLSDGKTLYARNPSVDLVPASNIKLVSTAAALHYLKPNFRFRTEIYAEPDAAGIVKGDLVIKGYGDPWLVPERVWQLANRLYYNGIRRIRGNIIVDESHFAGDRRALGFEQDRTSFAYMAPVGALSVSFNTIGVHVRPGLEAGTAAEVLLEPRSRYAKLEGSVETIRRGRTYISVDVEPHKDRSIVTVSGQISSSDYGRRYWRRIDNPPVYAGELLRSTMEQVGIRVDGRVRTGLAPTDKAPFTQIGSPPLSALIDRVNKHSNNFMAEQIARAMGAEVFGAPGTWDKAVQAIDTFLVEQVGLAPDSYALNNASGLHDVNRFSPEQLVSILSYMYRQPELSTEFIASLAVAGGAGTLSHRLRDTDAELMVRAKTGTLSISAALSGYVTAQSGEVLAFSMLVNDYETAIAEVWEAQDKVGTLLAGISFGDMRTEDAAPTASTMSIDE